MPVISRFHGIVITMFYRDHEPPHFHARHGEHRVTVRIADGIVTGPLPHQALVILLAWWNLHRDELRANWERARARLPLQPIEPLE
jgi:Domain of unknown function (DUF4160)